MLARLRALPRTETILVALASAVLVGLGVAQEQANRRPLIASYSSFEANGGGVRAFYDLLVREGVPVERFQQQPAFLTSDLATLVWIDALAFDEHQTYPTKADIAALEGWVRAGGHLLYAANDDRVATPAVVGLPKIQDAASVPLTPFVDSSLRALGVGPVAGSGPVRWRATKGKHVLVADTRGALVIRYAYGRGTVTAVADEGLFANDAIREGDRARLAYALATFAPGPVAFEEAVHGYGIPPHWWMVAPRPFVVSVSLALVALAIAALGAAIRLGPPVLPRVRDGATSSDFVAALAGLMQMGRAQRSALVAAVDSTSKTLARAFGLRDGASPDEIAARIEPAARRADFETMLAIAHNGFPDDRNLVRGMALAQELRKEYAPHADRRS